MLTLHAPSMTLLRPAVLKESGISEVMLNQLRKMDIFEQP